MPGEHPSTARAQTAWFIGLWLAGVGLMGALTGLIEFGMTLCR